MKVILFALACVIAMATSDPDCPAGAFQRDFSIEKCAYDLVFRGVPKRGGTSMSNDGPYMITNRWDLFEINHLYKGDLNGATEVIIRFHNRQDSPCPNYPYSQVGAEKLVFAMHDQGNNAYKTIPCTVNPSFECINRAAFDAVDCAGSDVAV